MGVPAGHYAGDYLASLGNQHMVLDRVLPVVLSVFGILCQNVPVVCVLESTDSVPKTALPAVGASSESSRPTGIRPSRLWIHDLDGTCVRLVSLRMLGLRSYSSTSLLMESVYIFTIIQFVRAHLI